jgi:deoxyribonuclease (pyrimidine dimer)
MTRINTIPVTSLTNQHALAEYKEITRVFGYVRKAQERGINKFNFHKKYDVPADYTLGTGHVVFFYNRLGYVLRRYTELTVEMGRRGYKPSPVGYTDLCSGIRPEWFGEYTPTAEALCLNRERIAKRLSGDKS